MKRIAIMLLCLAIGGVVANAQEKKVTVPPATAGKFTFTEETHDYGAVPEGPVAECDFVFKNTGKEPIVINNAQGSCGCTVPEWPHEPVKPGEKGTIHVKYTTAGHQGPINKSISIFSNAQAAPLVLYIKGTVTPKPAEPVTTAVMTK